MSTGKTDIPQQLTDSFLRRIRKQFYGGRDKAFFQERRMLLQALTWPARYLDDRAVHLTARQYQDLLNKIIGTIVREGDLPKIKHVGAYLLHCVQEHMRHHGDEYYELGKSIREGIATVMRKLTPGPTDPQTEPITAQLAAVHRVLATPRKRAPKSSQRELF